MADHDVRQFKVYLPADLVKRLKYAAIEEERSLSSMVGEALDRYLAERWRRRRAGGGRGRDGG